MYITVDVEVLLIHIKVLYVVNRPKKVYFWRLYNRKTFISSILYYNIIIYD